LISAGEIAILRLATAIRPLARLGSLQGTSGIARVFGLKITITVLSFALVTLAARALGIDAFGTYSLLFSAASLLGVAATLGQQVLVMRFWNEYLAAGRADLLQGALIFSAAACLLGCVLFGLPFYLWCAAAHGSGVALAATLYMALVALAMTSAHLVRTAVSVGRGDGYFNILPALPGALYLGFCLLAGFAAQLTTLFGLMAAGGAAAMMIHIVSLRRSLAEKFPTFARTRPAFEFAQWVSRSARLWVSTGLEAANQYLDVLVIGYLVDPVTAGAWFVLTRVANVISVATDAIHMFATRHIPELYYRRQFADLGRMLDTVAWVILVVIVGSIAGIVVAGGWLLAIFGKAYVGYHGVLIVLSAGAAAVAAAGPSASILMLTGHEGRYLAIIGGSVLLRIAGFAVLIPLFGIAGAAVAVTLSALSMTLLLRRAVGDCIGLDASVLRVAPFGARAALPSPQEQG
jgi:O-antigen/teichoic acid export membrane protein